MSDPSWTADHEGGRLTIDLRALVANWRELADLAKPGDCAAVVKADAYGLGLQPVSRALWQAGCRTFFVALPQEAFALRVHCPEAVIYCLGGLTPGGAADFASHGIRPVLNTPGEVTEWAALDSDHQAALHVDTGMTRLGLTMAEASELAGDTAQVAALRLALVMSHLACADEPAHPLNDQQIARFEQVRSLFPGVPGSLANSAGTLQGARFRHDLARPGIALYGGEAISAPSSADQQTTLRPVIKLQARIMQIRHAQAGEAVGYGARQTLQRDSRIAILGVGYADGYHRLAGSTDEVAGASVVIDGSLAPLVGRISMDLMAVDITDPAFGHLQAGDHVDLINETYTVNDVAKVAQTIGYEVLTGLGRRYTRAYVDDI